VPSLASLAGSAGRLVLDALLPPRCLGCGRGVSEPGALCVACWSRLVFLAPPACEACGHPFAHEVAVGALCGPCSRARPPFRRARAVLAYEEGSRALLLRFKHADRTEGAASFARWMAGAGSELIAACDLIVPVPLHWRRLFRRRYNQAALLSGALARRSGLEHRPDLLRRHRPSAGQGRLGRAERRQRVAGAFLVSPRQRHGLDGRAVLLIDDVFTTGATAAACTTALLEAGAAAVDVLTLARVVRPAAPA
jgi:ComF family protein